MLTERIVLTVVNTTLGLADAALRAAHVRNVLMAEPIVELAKALDDVALKAELGEPEAREALMAVVDAIGDPEISDIVQQLREEAAGEHLLPLDRLLRKPLRPSRSPSDPLKPTRPPDYGFGRPLTLGERKSLARKPDRAMLERLVNDPHPDVIRRLLVNPRLTEDDVVRVAAKRPGRAEILAAIARDPKWLHRPRVRMALLLNPETPVELSVPIAALLRRNELKLVAEYTYVHATLRTVCMEHYKRRVPLPEDSDSDDPAVH